MIQVFLLSKSESFYLFAEKDKGSEGEWEKSIIFQIVWISITKLVKYFVFEFLE